MKSYHNYKISLRWTGNLGSGTSDYRTYTRDHIVVADGKPDILLSSDPSFWGDKSRHNPEELLVTSLSSCHMLWFLHLCSDTGIVVLAYEDQAEGVMDMNPDGSGQFREVTLHPTVTVTDSRRLAELDELHRNAHKMCFIARSVNFPVRCEANGSVQPETG
jgi:organic hydroperoxide reductase OsmC/OhrA